MRNVTVNHSFTLTLAPGEVPASGAKSLSPPARDAIVACASAGRLTATRLGWHSPHHPRPIDKRTVAMLAERGFLSVRSHGTARWARLTSTGQWYARTLCSAIAGDCLSTEGAKA